MKKILLFRILILVTGGTIDLRRVGMEPGRLAEKSTPRKRQEYMDQ